MLRLEPDRLARYAARSDWEAVFDLLGRTQGLARWLMPQPQSALLGQPRPKPPTTPGTAVVLFAKSEASDAAWLADGFALPFCWRKASSVSTAGTSVLPSSVAAVAQTVLAVLNKDRAEWLLDLHPDFGVWDLGALAVTAESAFVALAAGLICADSGVTQQANIFATGAWQPQQGIVRVDGIAAKQQAILALDVANPVLFVPPNNRTEPVAAGITLRPLFDPHTSPGGLPDPYLQLAQLLSDLEVPPDGTDVAAAERYANRPDRVENWRGRDEYYRKVILPDYVRDPEVLAPIEDLRGGLVVVIANARNRGTADVLLGCLAPSAALIVYQDSAGSDDASQLAGEFARGVTQGTTLSFSANWEESVSNIRSWLAANGRPGLPLVVDCFGGTKEHTVALVAAGYAFGAVGLTLDKWFGRTGKPAFGKPKFVRLPFGHGAGV